MLEMNVVKTVHFLTNFNYVMTSEDWSAISESMHNADGPRNYQNVLH